MSESATIQVKGSERDTVVKISYKVPGLLKQAVVSGCAKRPLYCGRDRAAVIHLSLYPGGGDSPGYAR